MSTECLTFIQSINERTLTLNYSINEERTVFSKNGSGIIGHPYAKIWYYTDFTISKLTHNGTRTQKLKTIKCPE